MVSGDSALPGKVNVNQAPPAVLRGMPGMSQTILDGIMASRELLGDSSDQRHPTWMLTQGIVTLDEMKELFPYLTGGGVVFRGQVYGVLDARQTTSRLDVIWDGSSGVGRILFWRDMTPLGRGVSPELLGLGLDTGL
jgi:hypothetical protein